ncbi:MAG: DUF4102 domain-containing protein [Synergistaceae bacterium]|nr:DUF4102 domain-containing protein [Synergistaceae bacterium]
MRKQIIAILFLSLAVLIQLLSFPQTVRASDSDTVVVTPKGKKYHYQSCRTVKGKYTRLTVEQARKKGYKPCGVCNPPK